MATAKHFRQLTSGAGRLRIVGERGLDMAKKKAAGVVGEPEVEPTIPEEVKVEKKTRSPKKTGPKLYGEGSNYPIAEQLRQVIRASGLKQQEVADKTGIDFTVIYRFMTGDRDITMRSLQQLIKVFGGVIEYANPKGDG